LRWLASGSHIDLCFAWGVPVPTFYSNRGVLWPTIKALDLAYDIGLPIAVTDKLEELNKGFYDHFRGIFDGCVVAINGFAVLTWQLYDHERAYKKDYHYHKGGFVIVFIANCDVD
jgi:hypothetical protein